MAAARPTAESLRLRELAGRITDALAAGTQPRAALLAGSAAEGHADRFSDIDLMLYYERLPDRTVFRSLLDRLGARGRPEPGQATPQSFVEAFSLDGVEVQAGASTMAGVERRLDAVLSAAEPGEPGTKVVMGLLSGLPLHGAEVIGRWRARAAAYPDALARAMVERHLRVFPYWTVHDHVAARDARLFEVQSLLQSAFDVLGMLSGLNRVYFTSFQFKRMREHVAALHATPARLAERLESLFELDRPAAAAELRRLVEETVALVERRMPDVDTSAARAQLGDRGPRTGEDGQSE